MYNSLTTTATVLGRLIETELQSEFWWISREELTERRETLISLLEKRFAACFARELIRKVAAIQVDRFAALKD